MDLSSEKYLIITKTSSIILSSVKNISKNNCRIIYKGEFNGIESISRYISENLSDCSCLNINWNNLTSNMMKSSLRIEQEKLIINKIHGFLKTRRDLLFKNFIFFENNIDNDVETIEAIIKVKEEFIKKNCCSNLFYQIHRHYKNIVDIFIYLNDIGYKSYLDKLQNFLSEYQKVKDVKKASME